MERRRNLRLPLRNRHFPPLNHPRRPLANDLGDQNLRNLRILLPPHRRRIRHHTRLLHRSMVYFLRP